MTTSLYLSNERLMAVSGSVAGRRIAVARSAEIPLPAGSVINGVVTDEAAVSGAIKEMAGKMGGSFHNLRLVLNASRIYVKRAVLPKLPKGKLVELVAGQFADVDTDADDELIYDCMALEDLGAGQGTAVLACAAKRSLVASYVELFDGLKIKLSGMDATHGALSKLVALLDDMRKDTFITLAFDGSTLDATLFVRGSFRFNNRTRLMSERGGAESTAEISRMVSSIIQFNASERSGETISRVLVLGAHADEQAMMNSVGAAHDMPVSPLADGEGVVSTRGEPLDLSQYAYAIGNLIGA